MYSYNLVITIAGAKEHSAQLTPVVNAGLNHVHPADFAGGIEHGLLRRQDTEHVLTRAGGQLLEHHIRRDQTLALNFARKTPVCGVGFGRIVVDLRGERERAQALLDARVTELN